MKKKKFYAKIQKNDKEKNQRKIYRKEKHLKKQSTKNT